MGMSTSSSMCGHCGTQNSIHEQFCTHCGYALAGGATQIPPAPHRVTGTLQTGLLLEKRYRIMQMIGQGGFGAVYKATDERFQARLVAIKEMSDAHLSPYEKTQALQAFRHEANLLVQLNHPNLPNVSDFFEEGGKAYLVMEFIEGQTLENVQEQAAGPLDEKQVMDWAFQLCAVLHYLHDRPQPIIFRDMKPSNVMLATDGRLKLIDFGIARVFKAAGSKDTTLLGSHGYAPLEQYGKGQSDARTDIYALGATLYDLLTRMVPADAASRRVQPANFLPPRQINPLISPKVELIVLKAMEQEPADRYQSVLEMAQAILDTGVISQSAALNTISNPLQPHSTFKPSSLPPTAPQSPTAASQPASPAQQQTMVPPPIATPTPPAGISRRGLLVGGVLTGAVVLGGAGLLSFVGNRNNAASSQSNGSTNTISLHFTYSTEKASWIEAAVKAFHQSNPTVNNQTVQVVLDPRGSLEAQDGILNGSLQPTIWSPASFLELNQLTSAWKQKNGGKEILVSTGDLLPKSLVFSPLVFAVWQERARILQHKYGSIDWPTLHDALILKNGWSDIGGPTEWGLVKFGQTHPAQSNSGLLSITLLAYAYHKIQRGLIVEQVRDASFLKYFSEIEGAVTAFGRSSGTYLTNEVIQKGPAAYDVTTTYENLVLTSSKDAIARWNQPLQPFYPALNIVSDHPFALLQGSWVSPEAREAARTFRDFLLTDEQQRQALKSGFRPTNPNIKLTEAVPGNPFPGSAIQIKSQIQPLAQTPAGSVIDELLKQWSERYKDAPTALSSIPQPLKGLI
jgi:serine/threonine protein kinase